MGASASREPVHRDRAGRDEVVGRQANSRCHVLAAQLPPCGAARNAPNSGIAWDTSLLIR